MLTYRATVMPRSATLSPWQADTLFGHLCWVKLYRDGEVALEEFLQEYRQGNPPLLFSNGFPEGWLPRPLVPAPRPVAEQRKAERVRAMREAKEGKGIRWVSLEDFEAFRRGEAVMLQARPKLAGRKTVLKNQINRLTFGTTPVDEEGAGGNLYDVDELVFVKRSGTNQVGLNVCIYVKARDEAWALEAESLLKGLSQAGYGAKKAVGYGQFKVKEWDKFTGLDQAPPGANGFISLSNWLPAQGDPINGFYGTLVKYGKLGQGLACSENPFKFPLTMLTAGSSFYAQAPIRGWYGRLVDGIAPGAKQVVQYGYAFAVPARLAAETA